MSLTTTIVSAGLAALELSIKVAKANDFSDAELQKYIDERTKLRKALVDEACRVQTNNALSGGRMVPQSPFKLDDGV